MRVSTDIPETNKLFETAMTAMMLMIIFLNDDNLMLMTMTPSALVVIRPW